MPGFSWHDWTDRFRLKRIICIYADNGRLSLLPAVRRSARFDRWWWAIAWKSFYAHRACKRFSGRYFGSFFHKFPVDTTRPIGGNRRPINTRLGQTRVFQMFPLTQPCCRPRSLKIIYNLLVRAYANEIKYYEFIVGNTYKRQNGFTYEQMPLWCFRLLNTREKHASEILDTGLFLISLHRVMF